MYRAAPLFLIASFLLLATIPVAAQNFRRGDCNDDGAQNIVDALFLLDRLFTAGPPSNCEDACDTDDNGELNLIDAVVLLNALFNGQPMPAPFVECGADNTPDQLDCQPTGCPPPPPALFRINCGGPDVLVDGDMWEADVYATGGGVFTSPDAIDGTDADVLYQSERYGSLLYNFPVVPGEYEVVLHFAEIYWGAVWGPPGAPGQRVFDVSVEGAMVLPAYDIFAEVGATTATKKTYAVTVTDNPLTIECSSIMDFPKISAIEIRSHEPPLLGLDNFQRYTIDPGLSHKAIFVHAADLNGDTLPDICAGGWWYQNPGDPALPWTKHTIGGHLKNMSLLHDFDGDGDVDILGTNGQYSGIDMFWARNNGTGSFTILNNVSNGTSSYIDAFTAGLAFDVFTSGGADQIALSWNGGENGSSQVQLLTIPSNPSTQTWPITNVHPSSLGEGLSSADIDGDGDMDLFQGYQWLENNGTSWTNHVIATFAGQVDRNRLGDFDNDGDPDAVVGFLGDNNDIVWLENPDDPTTPWIVHTINANIGGGLSMDVADMDNDGDLDIIHGELWGQHRCFIYENVSNAQTWIPHVADSGPGVEHHDGTRVVDIDNDGDLDIVTLGWNNPAVWLIENLAVP